MSFQRVPFQKPDRGCPSGSCEKPTATQAAADRQLTLQKMLWVPALRAAGIMVASQVLRSHRTVASLPPFKTSWGNPASPAAMQLLADTHDTLRRKELPVRLVHVTSARVQDVPFHSSLNPVRFWPLPTSVPPTATHRVFDTHDTPLRIEYWLPAGSGAGILVQDEPFQDSMSTT
jgi:hypothetical protein